MNKKELRDSNIELLRIIAMLMVIMGHITYHCVYFQLTDPSSMGRSEVSVFNQPIVFDRLFLFNIIFSFGKTANTVFMLIAGFFSGGGISNNKVERLGKTAKKLLFQQAFAAIILILNPPIFHILSPHSFISMQNFTIFNQMSWYVGYYFLITLCGTLFLDKYLSGLNIKQCFYFIIIDFIIIEFVFTGEILDSLASGLRIALTGIFLYSCGFFIRKFNPLEKIRSWFFVFVMIAMILIILISGYNATETNIESYIRNGSTDTFKQVFPSYDNWNPIAIINGICLFELFRRIKLPKSRVVTFLGKSTFMVYLMHDNTFFYEIWNIHDWIDDLLKNPVIFVANIIKWALMTFLAGLFVYLLYILFSNIVRWTKPLIIKKRYF